jgi:hypothetical protein
MAIRLGRPAEFFRLFGQCLCQPGGEPKAVARTVNRGQIGQVSREVLTLPEQIDKVLRHIPALVQKIPHHGRLSDIQIVQEDPRCAAHDRHFAMGFFHVIPSCKAWMATRVFCLPRRWPYSRTLNDVRMATRAP